MQALKLTKKYEVYPEYKDSGVEWLAAIPKDWKVFRAKNLFKKMERTPKDADEIITAFRDGVVTLRKNRREDGFTMADKEIGYQRIEKGDLVIHGMDAFAGAIGVSDSDGKSSPVYSACIPIRESIPRYHAYLLRHMSKSGYIFALAKGIRERSTEFRFKEFSNLEVAEPSPTEQTRIAKYLDEKLALIDQIIEKKEKQIELLKEKRSTTVTNVATKGMNKSHKLVSSGSIWTNEIPEHWKIDRLSHYCLANDGGVWGEDDLDERGQIVLRSTEITQNGSWRLQGAIKRRLSDSEFQKSKLFADDLLLTKSSGSLDHLGKTAIVTKEIEEKGCAYSNFMQRLRLNKKFLPKYFFYLINNRIGREQIIYWGSTTSGLVNLNGSIVGRFVFPIPPVEEQEEIVNFLDKKLQKIDEATKKVENSIECLQEFKTSLISSVVTGKIKV